VSGKKLQGGSESRRAGSSKGRKRRPRPVLQFVVVLLFLMGAFTLAFYGWFSHSPYFTTYLEANAALSASVLSILGEEASSSGVSVNSPRFNLTIKRGCDAIQPSVFFALLVAASPVTVSLLRRCVWMIVGTLVLLGINLFRIISLYYTGVWSPEYFDLMHVEVWQVAFVVLPILLWLIWVRAMNPGRSTTTHAPT
jgi:exosortase/archaeosortase family protein